MWLSVSPVIGWILLAQVLEVAELALDLRVNVERLLAGPHAAVVAGDDEVAHLGPQRSVLTEVDRGVVEQPLKLRVHVERLLAASPPASEATGSWSISNGPLPISSRALRAPSTKLISPSGIATKTMIRITSPFERARTGMRLG
jgi:hypothetical protein